MSNLTDDGLKQLHAAVIARLKEFEMPNAMLPTLGVVRLIVDVYAEDDWYPAVHATIPMPDDEPPPPARRKVTEAEATDAMNIHNGVRDYVPETEHGRKIAAIRNHLEEL